MMRSGYLSIAVLMAYVLSGAPSLVLAVPPPASASCKISCTVADIAEWSESRFPDIALGELAADKKQAIGESALVLYTNGNVTVTADNSNTAELSFGSHVLTTKYKLRYNRLGINQAGGNSTVWYPFDTFLKEGTEIVHTSTSGAVEVILSVEASVEEITPQDSGQYTAVQTLTVCWKS
ncbi:MAG: hypothetical protein WC476_06040 [Phycisphaerae bacterium]|jgi:hypothetical protein